MKKYKALYLHTIEDLQNIKNAYKEVVDKLYNAREYMFCDSTKIIDPKIRVYNMVIEDIDNEIKLLKLRYTKLGGDPNEQ